MAVDRETRAPEPPPPTATGRPQDAMDAADARGLGQGAGWRHGGVRLVGAVVAGLGCAAAFPPIGWSWLAPIAAAALTLLCRGQRPRRAAVLGLVFGASYFLLLLRWLTIPGLDAWLVVSVIEALFLAGLGAALPLLGSLRAWPLWTSLAWLAVEYARSNTPLGGFAWGRLAFALDDTPLASYASLGGAPLVGFVAVLGAHLLAWVVVTRGGPLRRGLAAAAACALVAVGAFLPLPAGGDSTVTVAVVQGNIPGRGLDFLGRARTVTRYHLEATRQLMADVRAGRRDAPDVVLWPENSVDLSPFTDAPTRAMVDQAAEEVGVPLLIGAMRDGPDPATQVRNTSLLWEPGAEQPREVYHKRHPVPFGEYIPFRGFFTQFIGRLEMVPRDQVPGDRPGVFDFGPVRAGVVICFEVVWDGIVRDAVLDGSGLLLVQTNNATFLGTGQSEQQFAATRMRAIEHGRTTLIASTSGISGIVRPDGEVTAKSAEQTREVFVQDVPVRTAPTLATVLGPWPELLMSAAALAALALALWRRRRPSAVASADSEPTSPTGAAGAPDR